MFNQSVKSDSSQETPVNFGPVVSTPEQFIYICSMGFFPNNGTDLLKIKSFRSYLMAYATTYINDTGAQEKFLEYTTYSLRQWGNNNAKDALICATAPIAYAWGYVDLSKRMLLELNPESADATIASVVRAITMDPPIPTSAIKSMLSSTLEESERSYNLATV